jgi:hypothetical protein
MNRMKFSAWFICLALAPLAHGKTAALPDACGDDGVKFDVKTVKDQPLPAPEAGKALVVFIESVKHEKVIIRFAVDGTWVGAVKGNSFLAAEVSPGQHHLCAAPQSTTASVAKQVSTGAFTAQAGDVYYYLADVTSTTKSAEGNILMPPGLAGNGAVPGVSPVINPAEESISIVYGSLEEDEGARRVKSSERSIWVQKK